MEQLVKELVEKANLTEEQAAKATEVMLAFVKTKVPPMFQDKMDDILAGKFDMSSLMGMLGGSPMDMIKGMFSKK
ncbi:hypothetical protein DBR32_10855 [Taibaiella sp. KBW10]|uniref:hypothetical protein n=1 Tax=Taibaiella sp. KBW10 TaxID=2153357 RepID=UPI000F5B4246|nr:hypothetical protein [Taibaiella sp. KBW10]RQO30079.1 hypothetical protein DBR32_10855 [Taibaiella sp. KBW10]